MTGTPPALPWVRMTNAIVSPPKNAALFSSTLREERKVCTRSRHLYYTEYSVHGYPGSCGCGLGTLTKGARGGRPHFWTPIEHGSRERSSKWIREGSPSSTNVRVVLRVTLEAGPVGDSRRPLLLKVSTCTICRVLLPFMNRSRPV